MSTTDPIDVPGGPGAAPDAVPAGIAADFDPAAVPIRPAATVMVLEDLPSPSGGDRLHVLMLRRTARAVFAGDMWVYPGGRVDPEDEAIAAGHVVGLTASEADRRLGVDGGGLAFWVAALRECFEEAGILLARRIADGAPLDGSAPEVAARLAERRRALNAGTVTFAEVVREEAVELDAGRIHDVAHWITPLGSPRRFDTRFFLAAAPPGQLAAHDDTEVVHHEWVEPAVALDRFRAGELSMMTPTIRMLMCLLPFERAADALAAAALDPEPQQVRVRTVGGEHRIMLPGEAGWEDGDPDAEFGWVKLVPPRSG